MYDVMQLACMPALSMCSVSDSHAMADAYGQLRLAEVARIAVMHRSSLVRFITLQNKLYWRHTLIHLS